MRKFAKALAVVGAITPAGVSALGVGEMKLHSALNQRLLAEIPILVSPGEDISQLRVNLAPAQAFAKAGLARPYYLSSLRFKPIQRADGSVVIQVTSSEVIREPFLDFLLELDWPQGRMLREFTVLLDPPSMVAEVTQVAQETPETTSAPIESSDVGTIAETQYGPVRRGETLWTIAERLRPPAITTEQMALALFKANPHAFSGANLNALKTGVSLTIPPREALIALSPSQARREFQQHYQIWLAKRAEPASQSAAGMGQKAQEAPEQAQLKLEPPSQAELTASSAQSDLETLATIEALKRENETLKARLEALEKQVAALIELKQTKLAAVQAGAQSPLPGSAEAETVPAPAEETAQVAQASSQPEVVKPVEEPEPKPAPVPNPAAEPVAQASLRPDVAEPVEKPKPNPVAQHPSSEESSLLKAALDEPLYLSLRGVSLILLVTAGWMIWRRRQAAAEQADSLLIEMDQHADWKVNKAVNTTPPETSPPVEVGNVEVAESAFLSEFTPTDFDLLEGEGEVVDPLVEADVYLAYGRYQQAEELIRQALAEDPKRPELRLKLLEIFYAKEDPAAFESYAKELKAQGADQDPGFWEKVVDMGRELCSQSPLFASDEIQASSEQDLVSALSDEDRPGEDICTLDFDLGDFDLKASKKEADYPQAVEKDEQGIEFSFDLQALDQEESRPASADENFDLSDMDELDTKLDLARAYVDMEDMDAAREILAEVFSRGNEKQKQEAKILLDKLGLIS